MTNETGPPDAARVDAVYSGALELDPEDRPGYLDLRCGDDLALRRHVEALLRAAESPDADFEENLGAVRERLWHRLLADDDPDASEDLSGQRIHCWRIVERIARGGLATVYRARRDDGAFEQAAAFKVLRRGLDTEDVIARFRAERQILSSLDHPSIAQILDGGALPDGRPFLVLEFVQGLPITDHCEKHDVDLPGRLRLLIDVLHALHHAHARLVVHRDVKPSNILVSDDGHVRLLDFGIAKLIDGGSMPGAATLTRTGVSLLTPGYASPEQRAGRPVTTASDIYQAGLVLYELVTAKRPLEQPPGAAARVPPPSLALRGTPRQRPVRGDLDAITLKATHPDPALRYASADEMVRDLERYLSGRPVLAQPDTLGYRLRKLVTRKPWLVPLLALVVVGVTAWVVTLTIYSARLRSEQQLSAAVQQFMVDLFRSPDPYAPADPARGLDIRVVDALAIGQRRIRAELGSQPQLQAALLDAIADVYASLDQPAAAIELREESLQLHRRLYGARSPQAIETLRRLGEHHAAHGDLERAADLLARHLSAARAEFGAGSNELALAQLASGSLEHRRGNFAASRTFLLDGLAALSRMPGASAQARIDALILVEQQRSFIEDPLPFDPVQEAEGIALAAFGRNSLQHALVRVRLASSLTNRGEYEASARAFEEAIPVLEAQLGPDHASTLAALNNLGYLHHGRNDLAAAEAIHRELLRRKLARHGRLHREVADSYQNLAAALTHQGRYDESVPLHREAHEIFKAVLNADNYVIALPLLSIAYAEMQRGDLAAAEGAARDALVRLESASARTYLNGVARCLVGVSLERQGRATEGRRLVESARSELAGASLPDPYPSLCRLPADPPG